MSLLLTFESSTAGSNVNPADFTVNFPQPIRLDGNYEIGLLQANIWYSYYNISSDYSNNTLRYYNGSAYETVTIPGGAYQLTDINTYLHSIMKINGDYTVVSGEDTFNINILPNYNTGNCIVQISGGYKLDLSSGNLHSLLGFTASEITVTSESPNQVDITNGINNLYIHCSVIDSSYVNGTGTNDVAYSFVPSTPPFSLITIAPSRVIFTPVIRQNIETVRIYITDQMGRSINLNNQPTSYTFILRQNKNLLTQKQNSILSDGFKNLSKTK